MDLLVHESFFSPTIALNHQYGDLIQIPTVERKTPCFLVTQPDVLRHVLVSNHRAYHKGLGFERVKLLLGNGIIVSDGDFWRAQRRQVQPAFHRKVLAKLATVMLQQNNKVLHAIATAQNDSVNITQLTSHLSLNTMLMSLFSDDMQWFETDGENAFHVLADDAVRDLQLAVRMRAVRKKITALIEWRRAKKSLHRFDLVSLIMAAGPDMQINHLVDEIMTLIIAGHETTAATMNWLWFLLSSDEAESTEPELQKVLTQFDQRTTLRETLQTEAKAVTNFSFDTINQLPGLRAAIDETLRLFPPVWMFARKAIEDDTYHGLSIPAGSDVFISPYLMHHHSHYWPNPYRFDQHRFDNKPASPQSYLPFSAGPRRCIGDMFSIVELQLHFAVLLQRYTPRLDTVKTPNVTFDPNANLRARQDIYCFFKSH